MKELMEIFPEGNIIENGGNTPLSPTYVKNFDGGVWECFIHSWDFNGESFVRQAEKVGPWEMRVFPLPSSAKVGNEIVCRKVDMIKIRRRVEDILRKGGVEQILKVALSGALTIQVL